MPASKTWECRDLVRLRRILLSQSAMPEDVLGQAAAAIERYLRAEAPTLDHAFGLKSDRRKGGSLEDGTHAGWVYKAYLEYFEAMRPDKRAGRTETGICAEIGRRHGLGGDGGAEDDRSVASELKRILARYRKVIAERFEKQRGAELQSRLDERALEARAEHRAKLEGTDLP